VVGVSVFDAECDGADYNVIAGVAPSLKIIAAHPNDVGEVLVTVAEKLAVSAAFVGAVIEHHAQKTAGFGRIEEDLNAVLGGEVEHVIDTGEIGFIGFGEIVGTSAGDICGERFDIVDGARIGAAAGVSRAEEVDPHCVESQSRAVSEESCSFGYGEVDDECLGRIADYEKWDIALIDEVAVVGAFFDGIGGRGW